MNIFVLLLFLIKAAQSWKVLVPNAIEHHVVFGTQDRNVLRCAVSGLAPGSSAKVDWQFDQRYARKVHKHPSSDGAQFLTFNKKVTTSDSGRFVCVAEFEGKTQDYEVFVKFIDEPNFAEVESVQHPIINQDARIRCPVTNLPENNDQTSFEDDRKTLVFKNYSKDLDGTYTCNVPFLERVTTKSIDVSGYQAPSITDYNLPNLALEGKDSFFSCLAEGIPPPKVEWLKITNAKNTEQISSSPKYDLSQDGVLVIKNSSVLDTGVYICSASNELNLRDSRNVTLEVITRPRVIPFDEVIVREGESVSIPCKTFGTTESVYWVTHSGLKVEPLTENAAVGYRVEDNTPTLVVQNVQRNSNNKFRCIAQNKAGSSSEDAQIKVFVEPTVIKKGSEVRRAVIGGTQPAISISCNVTGTPTPTVKWYKDGNELEVDVATYSLDEASNEQASTLYIRPSSSSSFGTYFCEAENRLGKDKGDEIRLLQVLDPAQPEYKCDYLLPTTAKCELILDGISESRIPTHYSAHFLTPVEFEVHNLRPYENMVEIEGLNTSSKYTVKFMAHNEVDSTGWSSHVYHVETSAPRAPDAVKDVTVECGESCKIEWTPGRDNGRPITAYDVTLFRDGSTAVWSGISNETSTEVFSLDSRTKYEVRVEALNDIGASVVTTYKFETPEFPRSSGLYIMVFVIFLISILLSSLAIDFAIYRLKGRSLFQAVYRCGKKADVDNKVNKTEDQSLLVESGKAQV
ncbi:unnamed protein product [Bursaphelenchus xylophilus]|nr:unnamed protein product [Bursaphelenchus xylophilus]CAG9108641.1 unnamed protein product [Bursaphelenchus xylophilus]